MKSNVVAMRKDLPAYVESAKTVEQLLFDNRLVSYAEAAEFLNISERTLRSLKARREIPFLRVGGQIRFRAPSLIQYTLEREIRR